MKVDRWVARAAAAVGIAAAASVSAHDLTVQECHEGSDFIRNAALSRESGLTREMFVGRMISDIEAIQAFPPSLRWFVQDEEDQRLLVGAAEKVFDAPADPEQHGTEFLTACFATIERWTQR